MGEMAELALEQEEHRNMVLASRLLRAFFGSQKQEQEVFWLTNDQRRINIKDMEISHIKASLAKCKRDNWRMEAVPYLENELKRRKK